MRDYEILFIVRPELDEEQVAGAVKTVDTLIANLGGATERTNVWGKRRLAYEVERLREGHYVLTDFRLDPERLTEMEATLKISETVFRHLIVRKPERPAAAARPAQPAAAATAAEAAASAAEPPAAETASEPPASPDEAEVATEAPAAAAPSTAAGTHPAEERA